MWKLLKKAPGIDFWSSMDTQNSTNTCTALPTLSFLSLSSQVPFFPAEHLSCAYNWSSMRIPFPSPGWWGTWRILRLIWIPHIFQEHKGFATWDNAFHLILQGQKPLLLYPSRNFQDLGKLVGFGSGKSGGWHLPFPVHSSVTQGSSLQFFAFPLLFLVSFVIISSNPHMIIKN